MKRKPMVHIYEGPDCSGKSSIVFGQHYMGEAKHHQGPYEGDPYVESSALIHQRCVEENAYTWACDRFYQGEQAYGPVFRGVDRLGDANRAKLDSLLLSVSRPCLIVCLPPWEWVLERWTARHAEGKEMLASSIQLEEVYQWYRRLAFDDGMTLLPRIVYSPTTESDCSIFLRAVSMSEAQR